MTTVTVLSGPERRRRWTTAQKLRIDYVPNLSDAVHSFSASAKDVAGNQGNSSPVAVLGSSTKDTVSGAVAADLIEGFGGPDILIGGTGADTFIFHAGFGKDTISSFDLSKDVLAFDHNLFANVAAILANTTTDAKKDFVPGSVSLIFQQSTQILQPKETNPFFTAVRTRMLLPIA